MVKDSSLLGKTVKKLPEVRILGGLAREGELGAGDPHGLTGIDLDDEHARSGLSAFSFIRALFEAPLRGRALILAPVALHAVLPGELHDRLVVTERPEALLHARSDLRAVAPGDRDAREPLALELRRDVLLERPVEALEPVGEVIRPRAGGAEKRKEQRQRGRAQDALKALKMLKGAEGIRVRHGASDGGGCGRSPSAEMTDPLYFKEPCDEGFLARVAKDCAIALRNHPGGQPDRRTAEPEGAKGRGGLLPLRPFAEGDATDPTA